MRVCCFAAFLVCLAGITAFGQSGPTALVQAVMPAPVRDPQALLFLNQAIAHLQSAPEPVADLTLTANVAYTAGSDHETGTATLEALGPERGRVTLQLNGGTREQIRNGFAGAWTGKDGVAHAATLQNCFTDASWFAPLLILEAASSDPAVSVTLAENSQASGNPGIILSRIVPNQSAAITARIQKLGTETLYLDTSALLPVELDFNLHPDNDGNRDIPVEIRFSDYREVNGALIPFHIQKFIQHSLLLDVEVTAATVNSGLAASDFALPAIAPVGAPLAAPTSATGVQQ